MIADSVRCGDLAARYGGEDFLCLLLSDAHAAETVAERIRETVAALDLKDLALGLRGVTVSAGVVEGLASELNLLIALADQRLYAAKSLGPDRVVAYG